MRKISILIALIVSASFADPLDCSVLTSCDQNGKCSEELWIMAKCTQDHEKVFMNFLKMNMPEKTISDFEIIWTPDGTRFIPKH